jgi:hypothetical protein
MALCPITRAMHCHEAVIPKLQELAVSGQREVGTRGLKPAFRRRAEARFSGASGRTARGRPPEATNGSYAHAEHEGPGPVVGRLRSTSMGWYGSVVLLCSANTESVQSVWGWCPSQTDSARGHLPDSHGRGWHADSTAPVLPAYRSQRPRWAADQSLDRAPHALGVDQPQSWAMRCVDGGPPSRAARAVSTQSRSMACEGETRV